MYKYQHISTVVPICNRAKEWVDKLLPKTEKFVIMTLKRQTEKKGLKLAWLFSFLC